MILTHSPERVGAPEPEALIDRIGVGPQPLLHGLVDDRDRRTRPAFGLCEVTAAEQVDAERLVEMRGDACKGDMWPFTFSFARPSISTSPPPPPPEIGMRLDANAACTPGNASMRRTMSSTRRDFAPLDSYPAPGHVVPQRHQRPGIKPQVKCFQINEGANEEQRTNQRDQRQRDLRDNQRVADDRTASRRASPSFFQAFLKVPLRHLQGGNEAECKGRRDSHADRVDQRAPVDAPLDVIGHLVDRHLRRDQPRPDDSQRHAERHACEREDDSFGEQLLHDPRAARADGDTHGKLTASPRSASEQQVRNVRAGNEEHERDTGHHQVEHEGHVIREERFTKRVDLRDPALIGGGVLLREPRGNGV